MTLPVALAPTGPLAAGLGIDDWGLVVLFVIAGLARLVEILRGKGKRSRAEEPASPAPDRAPAPERAPAPPPAPRPDPWRRAPQPAAGPRPKASPPAPGRPPVVHDEEGPDHTLVELEHLQGFQGAAGRRPQGKEPRAQPAVAPPPAAPARPLAGRALLRATSATGRDRLRAALAWTEVLGAPRALRPRRTRLRDR